MRSPQNLTPVPPDIDDKRIVRRYVLLTAALFLPLLFTFITIRNVYPFAASTMMLGIRDKQSAKEYYILQGETLSGEPVELRGLDLVLLVTCRFEKPLRSGERHEDLPGRPAPRASGPQPRRGHEWSGFLQVNLLLIAIWALSGAGYFWPAWVIVWWGVALLMRSGPRLLRLGQ